MRFAGNKTVRVCAGLLGAVVLLAFLGPWLSPHDYLQTNFEHILQPPALANPEPTVVMLQALAAVIGLTRRRRN